VILLNITSSQVMTKSRVCAQSTAEPENVMEGIYFDDDFRILQLN